MLTLSGSRDEGEAEILGILTLLSNSSSRLYFDLSRTNSWFYIIIHVRAQEI